MDQLPPETTLPKVAAVGRATAAALRSYGLVCDYVGVGSDTVRIGQDFATLIGENERVLFPCSAISRRTIQQQLLASTVIDLVTYNTVENPKVSAPEAGILVFTSPSNAQAYLAKRSIDSKQDVIAMGHTTASFLTEQGVQNVRIPWDSSELALADAVQTSL